MLNFNQAAASFNASAHVGGDQRAFGPRARKLVAGRPGRSPPAFVPPPFFPSLMEPQSPSTPASPQNEYAPTPNPAVTPPPAAPLAAAAAGGSDQALPAVVPAVPVALVVPVAAAALPVPDAAVGAPGAAANPVAPTAAVSPAPPAALRAGSAAQPAETPTTHTFSVPIEITTSTPFQPAPPTASAPAPAPVTGPTPPCRDGQPTPRHHRVAVRNGPRQRRAHRPSPSTRTTSPAISPWLPAFPSGHGLGPAHRTKSRSIH